MRRGWVVAGAVFTVVGALLAYLPLSSTTSASTTLGPGEEVVFTLSSPLGTDGTRLDGFHPYIEVTVTWQGSGKLLLEVFPCGTNPSCTNASARPPVAVGYASSGSTSFPAQSGDYYAVITSGLGLGASQVTVQDIGPFAGGLAGMLLYFFGLIVFAVGWLRADWDDEEEPVEGPEPPTGEPPPNLEGGP
ncbi:MAG TPA: hypothetical protein VGU43_01115 [Thermoplasmata archaeon]|nr:hypothetical protein [Thermoplasmata archaeon]